MRKYSIVLGVLFILNFLTVEAQDLPQSSLEIKPYAGLSLPQSNFDDFASSGFNFGVALDKYFGKRFGLGLDVNFQSFGFNNPNSFELLSPNSLSSSSDGQWSSFSFLLGPTYKIGSSKFNAEVYAKGGLLSTTPPNQAVTYSIGENQTLPILSLSNDNVTGFGFNTGIRFNYKISDRLSVFVNPQYQYSGQQVEYFHRPITQEAVDNPDLLIQDAGELCYIRPNTLGINAGIAINLGRTKKPQIDWAQELNKPDEKEDEIVLKITSHKKNSKVDLNDNKRNKIKWEIVKGNSKNVKYFNVKVYQLDPFGEGFNQERLIEEKIVSKKSYSYQPKYKLNDKSYYHFDVVGLDEIKTEITNHDQRLLFATPPSGSRSQECLEFSMDIVEIICKDPAYDQSTGRIHYTGKITITNSNSCESDSSPLNLELGNADPTGWTPVPVLGKSIINDFMLGDAFDASSTLIDAGSDWNWDFVSSSPSITLAPGASHTFDIELWFTSVPSKVDFKAYGEGNSTTAGLVSAKDFDHDDEIDDCLCDPCEEFEQIDVQNIAITQDPQNHAHHSILNINQDIFAGSLPLNTLQADLVHFEEILPDDFSTSPNLFELDNTQSFPVKHLCQICNAHIEGLGVFEGSSHLDTPAEYAVNLASRSIKWHFNTPKQFSSGINADLQIGIPKINPLDCCSKAYKFTIRYIFETVNCRKCELLVDYYYQTN